MYRETNGGKMNQSVLTQTQTQIRVSEYVRSVYNWMGIGLALTGVVAMFVASNQQLLITIYKMQWLLYLGSLGLVFYLSSRIYKMPASRATGLFLIYAALMGAMLSFIFVVYTKTAIASTFFITAGTFIACSAYGWLTKRDLTSMGGFLFMGLIGLIIASIVNFFMHSYGMQLIISYIGVFLFIGLTAYDTQKIKAMAMMQPDGLSGAVVRKGAIIGALTLYLDFILMFQYLLFILGGSRD